MDHIAQALKNCELETAITDLICAVITDCRVQNADCTLREKLDALRDTQAEIIRCKQAIRDIANK